MQHLNCTMCFDYFESDKCILGEHLETKKILPKTFERKLLMVAFCPKCHLSASLRMLLWAECIDSLASMKCTHSSPCREREIKVMPTYHLNEFHRGCTQVEATCLTLCAVSSEGNRSGPHAHQHQENNCSNDS